MLNTCPKCGVLWPEHKPLPLTECPTCGVIFAKFRASQEEKRKRAEEQEAQAARSAEKAVAKKTKPAPLVDPVPRSVMAPTLATCPACGGVVAIGAKACPHCGRDDPAPAPKQSTKPLKWATSVVIMMIVAVWAIGSNSPSGSGAATYERCPKIEPVTLWLPKGHDQSVRDDFTAKAYWLNANGQCVLDGSFGESTGKYYYSVRPVGEKHAKHVRFTRAELRP